MLMVYIETMKVHPPTDGTLTPVNENADSPMDEDLLHSCDTPNLCDCNKVLDTPETHGRRCYDIGRL